MSSTRKIVRTLDRRLLKKEKDDQIQIGEMIGEGSVGDVYLGYHGDTKYAIKKYRCIDKFENEVNKLSYLASKNAEQYNIVRYFGTMTTTKGSVVLEYMPAGNLEQVLFSRQDLPWTVRYKIMYGISVAVNFLHGIGVIHRDIKPRNIFMTAQMEPRLGDFDVATFIDDQDDRLVGTSDYIAPELLISAKYSDKTDIYAVGITFYEIASRQVAFLDLSIDEALQCKRAERVVTNPDSYPSNVTNLIQWCTKARPKDRPTATDVLAAVPSECVTHTYNLRSRHG